MLQYTFKCLTVVDNEISIGISIAQKVNDYFWNIMVLWIEYLIPYTLTILILYQALVPHHQLYCKISFIFWYIFTIILLIVLIYAKD